MRLIIGLKFDIIILNLNLVNSFFELYNIMKGFDYFVQKKYHLLEKSIEIKK